MDIDTMRFLLAFGAIFVVYIVPAIAALVFWVWFWGEVRK